MQFLAEFDRDVWILLLTRGLRSFSAAILTVCFAIYMSKLGATSVQLGMAFTGMALFAALRSLGEGLIADRFGRKPVLLLTSILMAIGGLIFAFNQDLLVLTVSAIIFGVGRAIPYTPAEQAILTEKVSSENRTTAFSINSFIGNIAGVFGSFAAILPVYLQGRGVAELASYKPVFIIFALSGLVSTLCFFMIKETYQNNLDDESAENEQITADERWILSRWSFVLALDVIGGSFIMNFTSYWFYVKFGVGPDQIGTLFGASRIVAAGSLYLGLRLAKRIGTIRAIVLSRVPVGIINVLTPLMPSYIIVAYMRGFMSLFSMIDVPLRQSYLMGVIKSKRKASAAGIVAVVSRFTAAGAPLLSGYIMQFISIDLPFFLTAGFQLASASLMYYIFKDINPPDEQ
jgi:MFS family permease